MLFILLLLVFYWTINFNFVKTIDLSDNKNINILKLVKLFMHFHDEITVEVNSDKKIIKKELAK